MKFPWIMYIVLQRLNRLTSVKIIKTRTPNIILVIVLKFKELGDNCLNHQVYGWKFRYCDASVDLKTQFMTFKLTIYLPKWQFTIQLSQFKCTFSHFSFQNILLFTKVKRCQRSKTRCQPMIMVSDFRQYIAGYTVTNFDIQSDIALHSRVRKNVVLLP